jgi:hypothetical protein
MGMMMVARTKRRFGPPFGSAESIEDAKARFHGNVDRVQGQDRPEKLARAYEAMKRREHISGEIGGKSEKLRHLHPVIDRQICCRFINL